MAFPVPRSIAKLRPLDGVFEGNRGAQNDLQPRQEIGLLKLENGAVAGEGLSVALSISSDNHLTASEPIRSSLLIPLPRARVFWGNGNSRQFVDVDFAEGLGLSPNAETLEIRARYDVCAPPWATDEDKDPSCLPVYRVQASVAYGLYCCSATFTDVAFVATPGGRTRLPIPPFARSFTVLPIDSKSVKAHLRGFGSYYSIDNVIVTPLSNANQTNSLDQIPIPNGFRWVEIENADDEPVTAIVVFGIGI